MFWMTFWKMISLMMDQENKISDEERAEKMRQLRSRYGLRMSGAPLNRGLLRAMLNKSVSDMANGEKYYRFQYANALACAKYVYSKAGLKAPFVLVCENPLEAHYVCKVMQALWDKEDEGFMRRFQSVRNLVRSGGDVKEIEELSSELFRYVLPYAVEDCRRVRSGDGDEYAEAMSTYHDTSLFSMSLHSDLYCPWLDFSEAMGFSYSENSHDRLKYLVEAGIFTAILREDVWIVSKYPKRLYLDMEEYRLHHVHGPAVDWGYSDEVFKRSFYFIRGSRIPSWIFEKGFTYEHFLNEPEADIRAAMYEIVLTRDSQYLINFFRLHEVDRQIVKHRVRVPMFSPDGAYVGDKEIDEKEELVLYHTKDWIASAVDPVSRIRGGKLAFIRFVCPSTGSEYMICTSNTFRSALEAAKFSRPFYRDSEYMWSQRS